ncbi:hypothetical protein SM926_01815, partial [Escherichia coli]|nr:hypothetical protein [Escherichia coli]
VRQGGERFFNCLNGIRRIHTCIPGEKRQKPRTPERRRGTHGDNICLKLSGMSVPFILFNNQVMQHFSGTESSDPG